MSLLALVKTPRPKPPEGEAEAIARAAAGDPGAFRVLLSAHKDAVYGYLCRCGFDAALREDLAQEVFVKVHAGLPSYRPERPLRAWIITIAANTVRSHLRRRRPPTTGEVDRLIEGGAPDAFATTVGHETAALLDQALATLPMVQREVVLLCCVEMLPQEQVAQALDMPVNTVKTHLRRARIALAAYLERRGR